VNRFDTQVAELLEQEASHFGRNSGPLDLLNAYELPTHILDEVGIIITYHRSGHHEGVGTYHETRFAIYACSSSKQTSMTGGILAQSWEKP
jgi:hypothetical protein